MLKRILAIMFLLQTTYLFANSVNVKTKLDAAKVFLSGAELTHSAVVEIPGKGNYELIFEGLATNIHEKGLQVSASGELKILSVKKRNNYLKASEKTKEIIALEDSLEDLNLKKLKQQNENEILKMEIDLLNSNKQLTGNDKKSSVKEIQDFAKFYVSRLKEIKNSILSVNLSLEEIEKDIKRITNQLNEINRRRNQPSTEVVVNIASNKKGKYDFKISYFNFNARWLPTYDIRAKNINDPIVLDYKAEVSQNTNLEWDNIEIILSTRNPVEGGDKPEIYTWYLDFLKERPMMERSSASFMKSQQAEDVQAGTMEVVPVHIDFSKISETQTALEFIPNINYTIQSDNRQHTVMLGTFNIPARFEYYAAPKLVGDAFLVAYVDQWKELNLLPGQANIYFENSYVGQSVIDPFTTEKELTLSLGRDKNIFIERKLLKDFTEDKFLSSDVERQFAYEIKIKNNKKSNVKLILEEQFPISKNEDIKVELIETDGAEVDKNKGTLKWILDLTPTQDISKQFIYSVRYPSDKTIQGL